MRPKKPLKALSLSKPADSDTRSAKESLREAARARPDDLEAWKALFYAALNELDIDLARESAEKTGADRVSLLAELAITSGRPQEAIVLLDGETTPRRTGLLAWAYFCLGEYKTAMEFLCDSEDELERRLGAACSNVWKGAKKVVRDIESELRDLSMNSRRDISLMACATIAHYYHGAKDHKKVLVWARRGEWIVPRLLMLKRLIARSATEIGYRDMAIARWTEIVTLFPDDAEAHELLGNFAAKAGNRAAAGKYWERALTLDPFRGGLRVALGDFCREDKKFDEAVKHFETALGIEPQNKAVLTRLAELAWDAGRLGDALEYYHRLYVLGVEPQEEEESGELLGYLFAEHFLAGETTRQKESDAFFSKILEKFPKNLLIRLYSARCLIGKEQLRPAREIVERILREDPLLPEAVFEMGNLHILEGRPTLARPFLEKAATLDNDPFYYRELGRCFLELEEWDRAERTFKRALAAGSEDEEILLGLYAALFEKKKYPQSENLLRRILVKLPNHLMARVYLSEIFLCTRRFEEAFEEIKEIKKKAITLDEFQEGKGDYHDVVGPDGVADWLWGFALLLTNRKAQAVKALEYADVKFGPLDVWNEDLRKILLDKFLELGPTGKTKELIERTLII